MIRFVLCPLNRTPLDIFRKILSKGLTRVEETIRYRRYSRKKTFYYGSQWGSFTRDFCEYLVKHSDEILNTFRYTYCSDELYKQTLLMDSPFAEHLYSRNSTADDASQRFIDWSREKDGHPHTFEEADFDLLVKSPHMFARKFSARHPQLLKLWYDRLTQKK